MTTGLSLNEFMREGDYQPGPPPGAAYADIDVQAAAESTCPSCGHKGLNCEQFHRDGSYRAFATCPTCGHYEEF